MNTIPSHFYNIIDEPEPEPLRSITRKHIEDLGFNLKIGLHGCLGCVIDAKIFNHRRCRLIDTCGDGYYDGQGDIEGLKLLVNVMDSHG